MIPQKFPSDRRRLAVRGVQLGLIAAGLYTVLATGVYAISGRLMAPGGLTDLLGIIAAYGVSGVLGGWAVGWNIHWAKHPWGRACLGFILAAIVFSAMGVAIFGYPARWDEPAWLSVATTTVIFGVFIGVLSRDFFT